MADPFATKELVEKLWRPFANAGEETRAIALLATATRIMRAAAPTVDDRIASGQLDAELVADIAAQMVIRVLQNPDGYRSTTRAIDDYSETNVRDQALSDGALRLLDSELAVLRGTASAKAFSIAPAEPECTEELHMQAAAKRALWQ